MFSWLYFVCGRFEQHHRYNRLHLQQCRWPQWQTRRRQEEPVQLWLVVLLRSTLFYCGRGGGCSGCQYLHWEEQRSTVQSTSWVHQVYLVFFAIFSHAQLSLPTTALTLQLSVNGSIPWGVTRGHEDDELGARRRDQHVHIDKRPPQVRDRQLLQPRPRFGIPPSAQLLSQRP